MEGVLYQNQSVVDRIMKDNDVSAEEAQRWFEGMLQFLEVAAVAEAPVSPSLAIDEAWHAFILHTWDYTEYCQERFGMYVHHQPTAEGVDNKEHYLLARRIAAERFGDLDETVWPAKPATVAAGCGKCCFLPGAKCDNDHSANCQIRCDSDPSCRGDRTTATATVRCIGRGATA
jgi:hypothetical protein